MAFLTWKERNSKGTEIGPLWYIDFDATLLEEYTRSADITTFPVENGAVLADHHQPNPRAITLEVIVTDTPVRPATLREGMQNAALQPPGQVAPKALDLPINKAPVAGLAGQRLIQGNASRFPRQRTASVLQFTGTVSRVVDIFEVFDGLIDASQVVNVLLFGEKEFKNMLLANVRAPRTAGNGHSMTFTVDLVQVEFASTEGDRKVPAEKKHEPKRDVGNRNGTPVEREDPARARIVTSNWFGGIDTSELPPSLL